MLEVAYIIAIITMLFLLYKIGVTKPMSESNSIFDKLTAYFNDEIEAPETLYNKGVLIKGLKQQLIDLQELIEVVEAKEGELTDDEKLMLEDEFNNLALTSFNLGNCFTNLTCMEPDSLEDFK